MRSQPAIGSIIVVQRKVVQGERQLKETKDRFDVTPTWRRRRADYRQAAQTAAIDAITAAVTLTIAMRLKQSLF